MWESLMGIKTFFCAYFNRTTAFKVLYCLTSIECEAHTYMCYANISDIHTSHLSTQDMFQPITRSLSTAWDHWEIATLHKKADSWFLLGMCMRIMCLTPEHVESCRSDEMPKHYWDDAYSAQGQRAKWIAQVLKCKLSPVTVILSSFIPLLSS